MVWRPRVTVATIVEREGRYLFVREHAETGIALNQPAGHLENHETLVEAAQRETLEETGWQVEVTNLLGVSHFVAPSNQQTYIRFSFIAKPVQHEPTRALDDGIIEAIWLSPDELHDHTTALRSPLVQHDIERHRSGISLPLSSISHFLGTTR